MHPSLTDIIEWALAIATVGLGLKGFSEKGLPATSTTRIAGSPAQITGVLCMMLGLGLMVLYVVGYMRVSR